MAPQTPNIADLYRDVYQLKAEIQQVGTLVARLDTTIDKLTEVSNNISSLLAVQGMRLEYQEKMGEQLSELIEKIKSESTNTEKTISTEIEAVEKKLMDEMKSLRETVSKNNEKLDAKLAFVEKWMYVVSGGAVVVSFLISKVAGFFKLFG